MLRALAILDILVAEPRGLGLTEVARRADLNKATAYRLIAALQRAGLVIQDPATNQYRPGLKLVRMAEQILQAHDFRGVVQPHVARLAREVSHTVLAGVIEGTEVVYVAHAAGSDELRVHRQVGGRRAVHISSIGKAILAYLPPAEAEVIVNACDFQPSTANTIVDRDVYVSQLVDVRSRGWAIVCGEHVLGATSISAPVFDHTGRVAGAIGISASSLALRDAGLERCVQVLRDVCRSASADLGHVPATRALP